MNMRDCKRLKPGAMVCEAYEASAQSTLGMVIHKEYVEESHYAKILGGRKEKRYDVWVHWFKQPYYRKSRPNPDKLQCWEVKLLKNGE